jgi:4-oxalocrotonate tautomerase
MPVTRVAIRKGKSTAYRQAILDGIYAAQLEAVHISEGDRFMALSEHEASEFAYGADFLGIRRTDDLVQIQVFWAPGKAVDLKKAMYRKIVEHLGKNPGVRAEDIMISVFESAAENWSFGNGETQFFKG